MNIFSSLSKNGNQNGYPFFTNNLTEPEDYFFKNLEKGVICPCCGRFAKKYRRKINSGMAFSLVILYRYLKRNRGSLYDWVHINDSFLIPSGYFSLEYSKFKHWGILVQKPNTDNPSKKESGIWAFTEEGLNFLLGATQLPKYVWLYGDAVLEFDGPRISFVDCLKPENKFDYQELMRGS